MCKRHDRHLIEEDKHKVNKHMRRCSTSLVIRKIQIKITIRHNYIPIRISKIKNASIY
jgi:hypothetical protein